MARLDRLIQVLHEQRAETLQLAVGRPAMLLANGAGRALTKDPLTDGQILTLVREVADPESAPRLDGADAFTFPYRSPSGQVTVSLTPGAGGLVVEVRTAGGGAAAGAAPARNAAEMAAARDEIEQLFRLLVESGASDLHLRTGEPPLLRRHGEIVREAQPALTLERLEPMLLSIMSPREVGEFRDSGDTDWAYEIEGLARFRCNAGRDRHGPMAVFRLIPTTVNTADELGLSREVQNLCYLTKGLVVVTGPTGSGKSTTLAALVDLINRTRTDHIITIEDPIEFVHQSKKCLVTQRAGRACTRARSSTRCARRCARIPTSSWWARCATSRRSRSPSRRPRPGTSSSARCTRPPPRRPSTASSTSFRPTGSPRCG